MLDGDTVHDLGGRRQLLDQDCLRPRECDRLALGAGGACKRSSPLCPCNSAAITNEEVVVAGGGVRGDHERASFEHESAIVAVVGVGVASADCSSSGCATTLAAGVVGEDAVRESGVPGNGYSPTRST
jgi:hypothetical protein